MKLNFNQRVGLEPINRPFQIDSINSPLKNGIWNIYLPEIIDWYDQYIEISKSNDFVKYIWCDFMKNAIDLIPADIGRFKPVLRDYIFLAPWNEVYGLLEATVEFIDTQFPGNAAVLVSEFNRVFERESSGYRFVVCEILPITNSMEVSSIEDAISNTGAFTSLSPCNLHLTKSLKCLSQKPSPDYSNSIKEAISALEALVNIFVGDKRGTLGDTIRRLPPTMNVHPAILDSIKKIYGYASDAAGVRHGSSEIPQSDLDDAKFMLISCSAIINMLIAKAMKVGILPSAE